MVNFELNNYIMIWERLIPIFIIIASFLPQLHVTQLILYLNKVFTKI
jgi:hypothetical protein